MDIKFVQQLVAMIEKSNVHEIELEAKGVKIRVTKNSGGGASLAPGATPYPMMMSPQMFAPQAPPPTAVITTEAAAVPAVQDKKYKEIKSPIVGTFYRSPSPDAEPYTEVGSQIKPGAVLCIIEAMKLMNEIEADIAGTIVKVCVENGKPVEYNQVLFLVEP
ncbi:MAG TPA: acetyl-CoA carboxylase biotin carboxyl carrier protein [Bacteroidota bacterium]|nr:acetyl-CoA carboxylase biotin carboxyl carrier protein [Bacteroidota bacterium]